MHSDTHKTGKFIKDKVLMNYGSSVEENYHPKVLGLTEDHNLIPKICLYVCVLERDSNRKTAESCLLLWTSALSRDPSYLELYSSPQAKREDSEVDSCSRTASGVSLKLKGG